MRLLDTKSGIKIKKRSPFQKLKEKYKEFNLYQIPKNLWIIIVLNIIIDIVCVILLVFQSVLNLTNSSIILVIALICLLAILVINFLHFIFPLKFPIKLEIKIPSKSNLENEEIEYSSENDMKLEIPLVPEAPKKKEKISLDSPNLTPDVLERIKKIESPEMKVVLVNCERCKAIIPIPVPKKAVLESELPVVPISYVHKNLQNIDQHCITIYVDHDFDIRRQRISDVVLSIN